MVITVFHVTDCCFVDLIFNKKDKTHIYGGHKNRLSMHNWSLLPVKIAFLMSTITTSLTGACNLQEASSWLT